jgi:hypothetical protein
MQEIDMTVRQEVFSARETGDTGLPCPHPVSLETIELIQQALGQMARSLRRSAPDRSAEEAGLLEYSSWLPRVH